MTSPSGMQLGNFSVSLAVKDLAASWAFYQALGFEALAGAVAQRWLIVRNGATVLGLFQGAIERNQLTFNPRWDATGQLAPDLPDVRELQRRIKAAGIAPVKEADESSTGPASFLVVDPDGNPILFDQHV